MGSGLVSVERIAPGEPIIPYLGFVKTMEEIYSKAYSAAMYYCGHKFVCDSERVGNAARFANHSCFANAYIKSIETFDGPHLWIVCGDEPILPNDAITIDYDWAVLEDGARTPCLCGHPHCRAFIEKVLTRPTNDSTAEAQAPTHPGQQIGITYDHIKVRGKEDYLSYFINQPYLSEFPLFFLPLSLPLMCRIWR